jgi:hypothetical protein
MHEARLHELNSFLTLTYSDSNLPYRGFLCYNHFQAFMRRLRKSIAPIQVRFYMCGEYGSLNFRPHYHCLLFGYDFPDKAFWSYSSDGSHPLYRSSSLDLLWSHGDCYIGDVTYASAGYVARYCMKKVNGHASTSHYSRCDALGAYQLPSEFTHMSLRPGIGAGFFDRFFSDIYPAGHVVVNGREAKPPRYYDRLYKRRDRAAWAHLGAQSEGECWERRGDNTPARLSAKEAVQIARIRSLKRSL